MKVIVTIEYEMNTWKNVSVRKCPPNYKTQEEEYICELEDYTDDDIKNYLVPCPGFSLPDEEDV